MKFLADENIEREFIEALRSADVEILSIREDHIGITDEEVLQLAADENAVILTYDKDFGELIFRYSLKSNGVILLRLSNLSLTERIDKTLLAIREHENEFENAFAVISEKAVRIRRKE